MMLLWIFLRVLCAGADVIQTASIVQPGGIITAEVGKNVTLECFCKNEAVTFLSWYQQGLGGKPNIISTRMKHSTEVKIYPGYEERFQVFAGNQDGINHLIIKDLRLSDSATYYCGILEFNAVEFGRGTFLNVKQSLSNFKTIVDQPALVSHRSGDSVNLSCTVHTDQCAGEQSLFLYRHGAPETAIIYPVADWCTSLSKEKPHIKNCSLNLAIKSVRSSDAGMYYCALASCGEIVFGNGTRLEILGTSTNVPPFLVTVLIVALAVSIIVLLALAIVLYKLKKTLCSVCKGSGSHPTCSATTDIGNQDADNLHYAALNLNRNSQQHFQKDNVHSDCVYSRVRSIKE
ncbi:uncharacterized protein [Channa argus]|uniref:uncharacterized protein n=1 Tax=Channa argus TaxID=215402 RepID=UPI002947ABAE|nr:hypothetical protein Q8A73_013301 [Channa argus]